MPFDGPHRRLRIKVDLEADDIQELTRALDGISLDIERDGREERDVTSGGWGAGYHYSLTCNPDMTGDLYRDLLAHYVEQRRRKEQEATP
jgi:hypothetical protein